MIKGSNSSGGRNHAGRITCYHRGGGHKRLSRSIKFDYNLKGGSVAASNEVTVNTLYDPKRGGLVEQVISSKGIFDTVLGIEHPVLRVNRSKSNYYIRLASDVSEISDSGNSNSLSYSNSTPIKNKNNDYMVKLSEVPAHTKVHSIELVKGKGAQLVRGAGCFGTIVNQVGRYTRVRLPSGEERLIHGECMCRLGVVSGMSRKAWSLALHSRGLGKAGRSRWLGTRPTVRGTAMNPIDHPHGGGQGKTSGGRPSVTPWSIPKGVRTSAGRGAAFVIVPR